MRLERKTVKGIFSHLELDKSFLYWLFTSKRK